MHRSNVIFLQNILLLIIINLYSHNICNILEIKCKYKPVLNKNTGNVFERLDSQS